MSTESPKVIDSYPAHKPVVTAFIASINHDPINKILFQEYIVSLVDHIGDDDLYFELQDEFEQSIKKGE